MFKHYPSIVKATIEFLRLLHVKVNNSTVNEALQNHPDWPSLLCISDGLSKWSIENGAGKIDPAGIDELPVPFMVSERDSDAIVSIITRITEKTVEIWQESHNKVVSKDKRDFIKNWDGVYLIAEPNQFSGEPNYEQIKRKEVLNTLIPIGAFAAIVSLSLFLIKQVMDSLNGNSAFGIYLQFLILLVGVFVSGLLILYEVDKNNPTLQKVCTGKLNRDCSAILTGKHSKAFNLVSWSEVGLSYFTGGMLTLLFSGNHIMLSLTTVAWLNIFALPYIVFSVYYQAKIAKQWCILCLGIQALLLLGGVNVIANGFLLPVSPVSPFFVVNVMLMYVVPVFVWRVMKPYLLRLQEIKDIKHQYLRTKFNTEIFETLLKKQKSIESSTYGLGIELGDPEGKNTLIKVCNTYCGPCSLAHPEIEKLLKENKDLKVKIIFTTSGSEDDLSLMPARHLLAIAENADGAKLQKALNDWYKPGEKNYEHFAAKYPMENSLLFMQNDKIKAMAQWCKSVGISFTPTIFINGFQLPDFYNIEDLQYFLLEVSSNVENNGK